jgi:endonuclease/exonuclease/phosphatase family metal-dependent hydrolase
MFELIISTIDWLAAVIITIILTIIWVFTSIICGHPQPQSPVFGAGISAGISTGIIADSDKIVPAQKKYRILSFNVEYEAVNYSPDEVVEIINSLGADVVVLNEAHEVEGRISHEILQSATSKIASALDRANINHVYSHDWAIIASTLPVAQPHKGSDNKYLDTATLIDGKFYVLSAHLTDYPYQPFQLAHIPYCYDTCQVNICSGPVDMRKGVVGAVSTNSEVQNKKLPAGTKTSPSACKAESQMIAQATLARGADVDMILDAITELKSEGLPILLAGDFNEPSHLDWTNEAVRAGEQPLRVRYPTSSRLAAAGMQDLYRAVYPDPVSHPGHTWPARPLTREYLEDLSLGQIKEQISTPTDRIDFIYGTGFTPLTADVVVTPSDHNAVIVEVTL